jgi:hypothetical protein
VPAKFKYSREDATARYALGLLRIHAQSDTLERLHRAVEREIRAASRAIQRATRNEDLVEAVAGDEILTIEELLGLAFVAAQSFITLIRTELIAVNNVHLRYLKSPISFVGSNGYDALKLAPTLPAANCSEVEAINGVANYWKHSEEWLASEAKSGTQVREVWVSGKNNKRTVEIVTALGLVPNSNGNLRKAAKALGVKDFEDLSPIRKILKSWATELLKNARIEFGVKP